MRRGGLPGIMIAGGGIDIFYLGRRGTAVLQATYFITHRHLFLEVWHSRAAPLSSKSVGS